MAFTSSSKASESMSPINDQPQPLKRKNEEALPQTRSKRNRYISIACNECKRRKIKCNGQTPCQRCGNLSLECLYAPNCCSNFKDTEEFKRMNTHILALQDQVDRLFANLNELRSYIDSSAMPTAATPFEHNGYHRSLSISQGSGMGPSPTPMQSKPHTSLPRFQGPTSSAFNLGVAKSSLQTMGITGADETLDEGVLTHDETPAASPANQFAPKPPLHVSKDPIWAISKADAMRLCHMYQDEMGFMYPILDIDQIMQHATSLYTFVDAASRSGLMQGQLPGPDAIIDEQTSQLKLVLAVALTTESSGNSELGRKMYENVRRLVEDQLTLPVDIKNIRLAVLTAIYYFQTDDESMAWRVIGLAARLCVELGLHHRETYATIFPDDTERSSAAKLFWAVYCLDRRWSLGTGMPFALQDADIDPLLPKPDGTTPYLAAMVQYSRIGSRVWRSIASAEHIDNKVSKEDIDYLDYQVLHWHNTIPESLKYTHPSSGQPAAPGSRTMQRLRLLLYLRANQMRILIYRPALHTATSIMANLTEASNIVDVAKDTIRVLTHTNRTSDLYRTQQSLFNYFLISALAVLFLAVSHAPAQFSSRCRDEFYMALDLVRGFSANSYVSRRLWKTIKVLKEVGPKLGLNLRPGSVVESAAADDAQSSAAVAMAGLAGHQVDEAAVFGGVGAAGRRKRPIGNSPNGMANDLTNLFEAAGGFSNMPSDNFIVSGVGDTSNHDQVWGHEDELSRIMRDLF